MCSVTFAIVEGIYYESDVEHSSKNKVFRVVTKVSASVPFESPVRHRPEEPKIIVHYLRYDL